MPTLVVEILDGIAIDGFIPDAQYAADYSATLRGYGATEPLHWSVAGGSLPAGLTIDSATGEVSGTNITDSGPHSVTIRLTDVRGYTVTRRFQFRVGWPPIVLTAPPMMNWVSGVPADGSVSITGGTGTYTGVRVVSGALPVGVVPVISGSSVMFAGSPSGGQDGEAQIEVVDSEGAVGRGNVVWEVAVPPKILIGGNFTSVSGVARNYIARLNPDSTVESGFDPNANNSVNAIAVQPDGKIIIGGEFTQVGGATRNRIARLNADGTLDTGFNPGANNSVFAIAVQPDGKIIIGGAFTNAGGSTRNRIARLNANGTLDTGFNPNVNGAVESIALQPDKKVLIGGRFTTVGGSARNYLGRLNANGTRDTGFTPSITSFTTGLTVSAIAVQPDGKIVIGGYFYYVNGNTTGNMARLNANGTLDVGCGPNSAVDTLAVQPDGKVLAGGAFTGIAGIARDFIARVNADGTPEIGFNPTLNSYPYSIVVQPDGKIAVGGAFHTINGEDKHYITRLNAGGSFDSGFGASANAPVFACALWYEP